MNLIDYIDIKINTKPIEFQQLINDSINFSIIKSCGINTYYRFASKGNPLLEFNNDYISVYKQNSGGDSKYHIVSAWDSDKSIRFIPYSWYSIAYMDTVNPLSFDVLNFLDIRHDLRTITFMIQPHDKVQVINSFTLRHKPHQKETHST